jgi:hypothetical protein
VFASVIHVGRLGWKVGLEVWVVIWGTVGGCFQDKRPAYVWFSTSQGCLPSGQGQGSLSALTAAQNCVLCLTALKREVNVFWTAIVAFFYALTCTPLASCNLKARVIVGYTAASTWVV